MDFRVASNLASFRAAGFSDSPGRPVFLTSSATLSIQASGFPSSSISGFAGDGAPSRLESRILRRCRLTDPQVALISGPSVSPSIRSSGCPASQIVRLRLVVSQVALGLAPSGCASGESSSLPELLSSGISRVELPSCPGRSISCFRRWSDFQVALNLRSSSVADRPIYESPRISVFRRFANSSPSFLGFAFAVGSMMNPWLSSNFASSACTADESSCPAGPAFPA